MTHNLFGVYEGAEATLECIVEAYPLPVNNWIKGSKILKAYDDVNTGTGSIGNFTTYIGTGTNVLSSSVSFSSGISGSSDDDEMISLR